jgi:DNA-directed RNA polymerase sigma subunit (sigma70/sigma32)
MASVIKQPDGTYVATYKDRCRAWPRRQQARNWLERQRVKDLDNRASDVVNMHAVMSFSEVGKLLGISKERVRQLEFRALRKLRLALLETSEESDWFE